MTLTDAFNLWIDAVGYDYILAFFAIFWVGLFIAILIERFYPYKRSVRSENN